MKIISHRANINGQNKKNENTILQIEKTIKKFDCEIDVWFWKKEIYLGHDKPSQKIDINFLNKYSNKLWIHAKNKSIISILFKENLNWFWHEEDVMTLTSKGFIWLYPKNFLKNGITVVKDNIISVPKYIMGVCTDYPVLFKRKYNE